MDLDDLYEEKKDDQVAGASSILVGDSIFDCSV